MTPKQAAFCLAYIEEGYASAAYRKAYNAERMKPETVNRNASALLKVNKIATRVAELQAGHQERHGVTVDGITEQLNDDRKLAHKVKQPGAAVSASMGVAKLHGFLFDRHEHSGPDGGPIDIAASSEWQTITAAVLKALEGHPEARLAVADALAKVGHA